MAYYMVATYIDEKGDLTVKVQVPIRFITPSTKYMYSLKGRDVILKTTVEYFNKVELQGVIKNAELDFKSKFGESIHITKLEYIDSKIEDDCVVIIYRAKSKRAKPIQNNDIIL